jgi:hypothetical protein
MISAGISLTTVGKYLQHKNTNACEASKIKYNILEKYVNSNGIKLIYF